MKLVKLTTILPFIALLLTSVPSSAMVMYVEGNRLIVTGPLSGFELTQFSASLAPNITTVVLTNSSGGDFASGLNLASIIRQRGLATVAKGYCQSSCANAFLGGVRRYLADDLSSVAFHGHYDRLGRTLQSQIGQLRNFYAEMTGGKVSDNLVQQWLQKPHAGMIYFFRNVTFSCNGNEPKRPFSCEKLPQTAQKMGIITSLEETASQGDVKSDDKLTVE